MVSACQASGLGILIHDGRWLFNFHDGASYKRAFSDEPVAVGRRVHVAAVWDGQTVRLFIDGVLQKCTARTDGAHRVCRYRLMIGADPSTNSVPQLEFTGLIHTVRVTTAALYQGNFTPETAFQPHDATILLMHLDEGQGSVAHDSSGKGNDGQISGATWVKEKPSEKLSVRSDDTESPAPPPPETPIQAGDRKPSAGMSEDESEKRKRLEEFGEMAKPADQAEQKSSTPQEQKETANAVAARLQLPADAQEFQGHYYKLYDTAMTWHVAAEKCGAMGGHVVRIETDKEQEFVAKMVQSGTHRSYWIDGSDAHVEGQWRDSTGRPLRYANWDGKEPGDWHGVEHYATLTKSSGGWHDNSKGTRLGFLCEWDR